MEALAVAGAFRRENPICESVVTTRLFYPTRGTFVNRPEDVARIPPGTTSCSPPPPAAPMLMKTFPNHPLTSGDNCTSCTGTVIVALNLHINPGSSVPIYKQIVEQVRHKVATERLGVTDQLPSVRALAELLVLNPNTVARAYAELAREGVIETRPGRGVFIIAKRRVIARSEARRRLDPLLNTLISEALAMDFSRGELKEAFEDKLDHWSSDKGEKS